MPADPAVDRVERDDDRGAMVVLRPALEVLDRLLAVRRGPGRVVVRGRQVLRLVVDDPVRRGAGSLDASPEAGVDVVGLPRLERLVVIVLVPADRALPEEP